MHCWKPASRWKSAIKHSAGRLRLPERPDIFVPKIRDASGIAPLDIDEESAVHAGRLPGLHSDPFDRMLNGMPCASCGDSDWDQAFIWNEAQARRNSKSVQFADLLFG